MLIQVTQWSLVSLCPLVKTMLHGIMSHCLGALAGIDALKRDFMVFVIIRLLFSIHSLELPLQKRVPQILSVLIEGNHCLGIYGLLSLASRNLL